MKFSGDAKDLVRRIGRALEPVDRKKPIAFLFGSGLTLASVPGVNDIVIRARGAIDSRDHADFDREVATFEAPSEKYQAALGFVKKRFGAEFVDEIIAKCTLAAYDAENVSSVKIITDNHSKIERDYSNWNIPAGVESLGRILCGLPRNLRGKVLTTNFDPLIEVAISKAGSNPHPMGIDAGGQSIYVEQACDIYHLNGYWRDSITLHNVTDLKAERPNLSSMIRDIVTRSILVVVGYSGWIDAVMLAIEAMIDDGSARRADILWCTFENETKLVESFEKNEILKRLNNELTGIQFYTEIDANEFFPELEKSISEYLVYDNVHRAPDLSAIPVGWSTGEFYEWVDSEARIRAIEFFDGRVPTPRDGFNSYIPRRDVVETVCNNIRQSVVSKSSSFDVIQGPSGEGKTTALFQVMATMKLEFPKAVILNFTHSASLLTPDILTSFEQSEEVFLFLDEVDKAIPWVQGIISQIHELNFRHIHLISAVRDIQWQFSGGATVNWNAYVKTRKHSLSQLSRPDALSLVSSWAKIGREALGELALIADVDGRVERLLSVAQSYRGGAKNSLFGAMLEIRYGDGLKEHVRELLGQLKDRTFYGRKADGSDSDSYNFAEAFLVISLMHDVGNTPISKERLGSVFGLGQAELANSVLVSLGEESPVAFEGNFVVTRHRSIAASALSLGQEMGIGVEYLVERLVRKAVEDAERPTRGFDESLRPYCYLARSLELGRLQIVAAEAAVDASPNRLSYRSTLSAVYRQNEILDLALKANVDAALLFPTAADRSTGIRVSLHEWAVTAGSAGSPYANAFLAGLALADLWPDSEMNFDQISKTLMVVGIGLENAIKEQPKYPYMAGLNAVVELFELCRPYLQGESESKVERRLKLWKDEISSFGVETNFKDLAQIFSLLLRALQEARSNCESEYVRPVQGMKLQFERLHKKIRSKLNYGHNYAYTDR